ncbi:MAG: DUF5716 family protein [Treponema sp.]|nr:DUF5716 family protein [Treponema sp.]
MLSGIFSILPENFFSPLATPNRQHYAALLVLYYRLFQENYGLERELVVREFMNYLSPRHDTLHTEEIDDSINQENETFISNSENNSNINLEFNFDAEQEATLKKKSGSSDNSSFAVNREIANRFLRRLVNTGWLSEETLADFTRVINITAWGKPFFEAFIRVEEGLKTEYESHVVNVYSSLCGETVKENGHFMVLKAREEARSLIDSLKVLSQSIKGYYDKLNAETIRSEAASVLHEHYNFYVGDVLDRAYKRLKTSDNVSRYRQSIYKKITKLLHDNEWLNASAGKYMRILSEHSSTEQNSAELRKECRNKLQSMLEEIRNDLKSVDPLEDEIDKRNADYSRSSTEKIRAYIEPDSTIAGKIGIIIKALYSKNKSGSTSKDACEELRCRIGHGLFRIQFISPTSLALHRPREEGDFVNPPNKADTEALDEVENAFMDRMAKRLSIKKIGAWLDRQGGTSRILFPKEIIKDEDSYIRFIYSLLYGDSRNDFSYSIEETENADTEQINAEVKTANYIVPDIRLRRKNESRS